ncbi:MAG: hypothetical protein HRT38_06385 [Alteromonadaceae bacterium]|nr:hypothetical protein [Alteromonadaceae bacterium]
MSFTYGHLSPSSSPYPSLLLRIIRAKDGLAEGVTHQVAGFLPNNQIVIPLNDGLRRWLTHPTTVKVGSE